MISHTFKYIGLTSAIPAFGPMHNKAVVLNLSLLDIILVWELFSALIVYLVLPYSVSGQRSDTFAFVGTSLSLRFNIVCNFIIFFKVYF